LELGRTMSTAQGPWWLLTIVDGWTGEDRGDHVAIIPSSGDAELRVTTFDPGEARLTAEKWIAFCAHADRRKGRRVEPMQSGDFTGHRVEFAAPGLTIRGWALEAGGLPVDVTYRGAPDVADRDRDAVDAMVRSLRFTRLAG
jgi:hypothetical protein